MFTKFFRGTNVIAGKAAGTGLGLYLVFSLVQKLGGKIAFTSDEKTGTTFTLVLPSLTA